MKFLTEIDTEKYTEFVKNHKLGNMMQATEWAQIKNTWGVEHVAVVDDDNNIIAATQLLTRKGLWYAPRGPIMDYDNEELVSFFLENLKKYVDRKSVV